jgi:8-oxo-dGTP diphosphatase
MTQIMLRLWRLLRGPLQWRALYFVHAKFLLGVTGACWDHEGRVLLVKHRFWPEQQPWGLPSGYAKRHELLGDTLRRELREETGYELNGNVRVIHIRSGFRLRLEILLEGHISGGNEVFDKREVLDARFFSPDALPSGILDGHKELVKVAVEAREAGPTSKHLE